MQLEQLPPNQPNFLLVVLAFAATIIVVFLIALFFLHWDGGRLVPKHHARHPTSQLVLPAANVPA